MKRKIVVSGRGEVRGRPDVMTVQVGVSLVRETVGVAATEAASLAAELVHVLQFSGVESDDIQTANYSIHPEYEHTAHRQRLVGYRVTNALVVKIRDLEQSGAVLDAVASVAGDDVTMGGVGFEIEDDAELVTAAREQAWNDAVAKARQLADLAGLELGNAISIEETVAGGGHPVARAFAMDEAVAFQSTPIETGSRAVIIDLRVAFQLLD
ncbi:MAG: SIMPL domain-containing protein [Acidimicrobiia bacterium]|nr:SIMPL domain-containing protein [Acidimicrobiia bacterium]NNL26945.1 SIMPL domain-containing protein [Acidimicrobiia bacterium]